MGDLFALEFAVEEIFVDSLYKTGNLVPRASCLFSTFRLLISMKRRSADVFDILYAHILEKLKHQLFCEIFLL